MTKESCKDCLHYKMCLERFRKLKKENHYILIDESKYFAHADDCDFHIKSASVAREIIEEIKKFQDKLSSRTGQYEIMGLVFALEKKYRLKKKYTEEGE